MDEESESWVQRACVVVNRMGTDEEAENIVENLANEMGARYAHITWYWTDEPPEWMAVSTADQVSAHRRDAGPEALYLVCEVWEIGPEAIQEFTDDDE